MIRILFATDFHLRSRFTGPGSEPDEELGAKGLSVFRQSLNWLLEKVRETGANIFVFGGDLVDNPKTVDFRAFNLGLSFFAELQHDPHIRTVSVTGNHDIGSLISTDSATRELPVDLSVGPKEMIQYTAVSYLDEVIAFRELTWGNRAKKLHKDEEHYQLMFVGYHATPFDVPTFPTDVAFCHLPFSDYYPGGAWEPTMLRSELVVTGHSHMPAVGPGVIVPGALIPRSFADSGLKGSALLLELTPGNVKIQKLVNPYAPVFWKLRNPSRETIRKLRDQGNVYVDIEADDVEATNRLLVNNNYPQDKIAKVRPTETRQDQKVWTKDDVTVDSLDSTLEEWVDRKFSTVGADVTKEALLATGRSLVSKASVVTKASRRQPFVVVSVEMEGFLSVAAKASITLPTGVSVLTGENLDDGGSNGAGKSTLIEAVFWCLYGETIRELGSKVDVVCHDSPNCTVSVLLRLDDADVRVVRRRTRNNADNNVQLFLINTGRETEISSPRMRETNIRIVDILGIDADLFRTTVLMSKRSSLFTEKSESERVADLLKFSDSSIENAGIMAKEEYKRLSLSLKGLEEEHQRFVWEQQSECSSLIRLIDSLEESSKTASSRIEALRRSLVKAADDLTAARVRRDELEHKLEALDVYRQSLAEYSTEIEAIRANARGTISVLRANLDELQAEAHKVSSMEGTAECPYCKQVLDAQHVEKRLGELRSLVVRAEMRLKTEGVNLKRQENAFASKASHTKLEIERLEKETRGAYDFKVHVVRLETNLENLHITIAREETDSSSIDSKLQELRAKLSVEQGKEWEHKARFYEESNTATQMEWWASSFSRSGLPMFLLEKSLNFANVKLIRYMGILTEGHVACSFEITEEGRSKGVKLLCSKAGKPIAYGALSDGQQSCVDLAVQFTLHDVQRLTLGGLAFMVLDEAVGYLDGLRANRVVQLLQVKEGIVSSLFVSHRSDVDLDGAAEIRATLSDGRTTYQVFSGER